jgi:site-specific DNA recombinase
MNRTIGYTRVSTTDQADFGYSLEAQEAKIRAYCDLHDLGPVTILSDTGSGKSMNGRTQMQTIMERVRSGKVDNVVIFRLDRLARNTRDALELAELFQKHNVSLHSISEKLDTGSATGRLFYTILSAMAAWERETISERTKTALSVKRDKGQRISRHAPFGFSFDNDGNLVTVDSEQKIIVQAKRLHTKGESVRAIGLRLASKGLLNRNGKPFGKTEVWKMLQAA